MEIAYVFAHLAKNQLSVLLTRAYFQLIARNNMKKHLHKTAMYTALFLISSLSLPLDVFADAEKQNPSTLFMSNADKSAVVTKHKILTEKEPQIVKEVADAVSSIHQALEFLNKNDMKKAFFTLQTASEKLEVALTEHPALVLAPVDIEVDASDFQGDAKTLEQAISEADDLLDDGKLQAARQILSELASEIRITTISMPLGSFPTVLKEAMARVNKGEIKEAESLLNNALNMLVETTEIIPLPFLRAEALVNQASDLEHKKDMSKEKIRENVLKLTDAAKEQLKVAELLGYGDKDDFKVLYTEIDGIKETLHSEKSAETWEKIKHKLSELKNKVMQSKK
ncbi:MAG: YfdX family protein [Methylobacter sp.]